MYCGDADPPLAPAPLSPRPAPDSHAYQVQFHLKYEDNAKGSVSAFERTVSALRRIGYRYHPSHSVVRQCVYASSAGDEVPQALLSCMQATQAASPTQSRIAAQHRV